jgi:hypothetical protein
MFVFKLEMISGDFRHTKAIQTIPELARQQRQHE